MSVLLICFTALYVYFFIFFVKSILLLDSFQITLMEQYSMTNILFVSNINLWVSMLFLPNGIKYTLAFQMRMLVILPHIDK